MNWNLFAAYVAIGALTELLSMRYPSPGRQVATGLSVLMSGVVIAVAIPPAVNGPVVFGLAIAGTNRVFGRFAGTAIDKARIWIDAQKYRKSSEGIKSG